jgi:DNA segregation ATPase FtsK/SpoIIIE, S-DNA-T family
VRIEFTISHRGRSQDVAVTAPDDAAVCDVTSALAANLDAPGDAQVWCTDRPLAPSAAFATTGVRTGSRVTIGAPSRPRGRAAVLALHIVGGPAAGQLIALERGQLCIGRDADCDVCLPDADVSRRHARIEVGSAGVVLYDLDSTNGTRVDGRPVPPGGTVLRPGGLIAVGDSFLTLAAPVDAPATLQAGEPGSLHLLRPPRRRHLVADREIDVPTRSAATRPRGVQWVTALLPAVAGGAIAWFAHSPQFLLFALLSPVMMLSTALGDRLHWRRSRRIDATTFRRRRDAARREIDVALLAETTARRSAAPDPAAVLGHAGLPSCRVWERRRSDPDLLSVRLGIADLPSTLRAREGPTLGPAAMLTAVPLCVDLRRGPLGVAGPRDVVTAMTRWIIGQLAVLHSPGDLKLALLLTSDAEGDHDWTRWLPQLHGRVATREDEWAELVSDLTTTVDLRLARRRVDPEGWRGPWLVLVVDDAAQLAEVPGLADLIGRGSAAGITALCVAADDTALPTCCAAIARVHGDTGTRVGLHVQASGEEKHAVIDQVSPTWAEAVARHLAPLVDAGAAGSSAVADECRLLDAFGIERLGAELIERRWANASGGARTVLGRSADGWTEVDFVADGPHALVAGTTGAGKSELLQTMVAGLAVHQPPDEINFLLIDYKGGAAFADCARLPHTAGLVTDLDPYLTERALRSLRSELRRRERLFADAGAADLAAYRAAPGDDHREIVARLIIVVDEFASLVDELPEFVRGLIGVAQRGRSLGVHLVLATQRPGSAVSPEIRANTSLRVALRVTDAGESTDVIDSPDAAFIDQRHPGRAYLRAGSTLTCFQTAHAAAAWRPDRSGVQVEPLGPWLRAPQVIAESGASTDVAMLVDAVREASARSGRAVARSPWLPPLRASLAGAELTETLEPGCVALAQVDLPDEQRRTTLTVDLATGSSLLASGSGRSGRTGVLTSLAIAAAGRLGPERLHLHVLDPSGELGTWLLPLPHCATVLGPDDIELAPRLLRRLERECSARLGGGATYLDSGTRAARMLLLVDDWETLLASLPDVDAAGCADALAALLRIGPTAGLSVALAGDRSTLAPRFATGFGTRLLLRLPDRSDYGLAGIATRDVPATMPPGRGLRAGDGALLQVAHAGTEPGAAGLRAAVAATADPWLATGCSSDPSAIRIRSLPARIALDELPALAGGLSIGVAGDQADPLPFDPFGGAGRVLVAGPPRSGRTTLLRSIARQAQAAGMRTVVAASSRSALAEDARHFSIPIIGPGDADPGAVPSAPTLLLVDDSETFVDSPAGDRLTSWVRAVDAPLAAVVAGRCDDLATTYRGVAAEVRRSHCGILLRPGPVDGELLGVRLPRRPSNGPPGRGVVVGDPSWGPLFDDGEPVPIQVAAP